MNSWIQAIEWYLLTMPCLEISKSGAISVGNVLRLTAALKIWLGEWAINRVWIVCCTNKIAWSRQVLCCCITMEHNRVQPKLGFDMPKGCGCNCKQQVNVGWIRAEAPLRLWGCDNGVSNNSLLAWQWGVSEEGSKGVEQYVNCSNYRSLIDDRNERYEGGKTRILLSQRGEEKALGKLGCVKWSARCGKRSMKHEVSRSERTKLIEVFRKVLKLGVKRVNCCLLFVWWVQRLNTKCYVMHRQCGDFAVNRMTWSSVSKIMCTSTVKCYG